MFILRFFRWVKYWLWIRPTSKPEPLKATDVESLYVVIDYKGQYINLRITEVKAFHALSRKDKRAMAQKFATMQKKGVLRFETINGKPIAIWNKDYAEQKNIRQSRIDKARKGQ